MSSARVFHVVEMPNARGDYHVQGTDMVLYDVSPNAKSMLGALYNKWQTVEGFGKDGVIFVTPFGMFATYSYHVGHNRGDRRRCESSRTGLEQGRRPNRK